MAKEKKPKYPIHMQGKHCGYELLDAEGTIRVASYHYAPFEDALMQQQALDELVGALTRHCQKLMVPIEATKGRFWDALSDDYGIDTAKFVYSYDRATHAISRTPKPSDPEK